MHQPPVKLKTLTFRIITAGIKIGSVNRAKNRPGVLIGHIFQSFFLLPIPRPQRLQHKSFRLRHDLEHMNINPALGFQLADFDMFHAAGNLFHFLLLIKCTAAAVVLPVSDNFAGNHPVISQTFRRAEHRCTQPADYNSFFP